MKCSFGLTFTYTRMPLPLILAAVILPPALSGPAHGSASPADSVHVCAIYGYEQRRRDHPRPAAKRLADLDVGEPRTIRMIYFLPNDWSYRADVVDAMKTDMKQAQTFYANQMQSYGYGRRTFLFETDAQGEPLVHRVDGQHPFSHYDNTLGTAAIAELEQAFDLDANIYFIVLGTDALRQGTGEPAGGVGWRRTKNGGALVVPNSFDLVTVAHELGHTFGLEHDFRDPAYLMSYSLVQDRVLSACAAEFLAVHPYFNSDSSTEEASPPTIELLSPTEYPAGSKSVSVQLNVSASEGLHQVSLPGLTCHGLAGEEDAVVTFEYEGQTSNFEGFQLSFRGLDYPHHRLGARVVDTDGNVSDLAINLSEVSPYRIATLEPSRGWFVTDEIMLVSFTGGAVEWFDVTTRERIPLEENPWGVPLAISPDGTLLASDTGSRIEIWHTATGDRISTLEPPHGRPMAFSQDGTTIASASGNTVRVWEVATGADLATLSLADVVSVGLSPDGTAVASGTRDGTVRLWDVGTQAEMATLRGHSDVVFAVVFSPDGSILASGSGSAVQLWDTENQTPIRTLRQTGWVQGIAFSPDGAILAASSGFVVSLQEVATGADLATLAGHTNLVHWVEFSPDGTRLASGAWDETIIWDTSEWTGPRPFALETVSGDGQQASPGAALPQPLVVEVRDQHGNPFPDAVVAFTVVAGDGQLSGRFAVEHVTTGADGRAELIFTLGPEPGKNIVGVSLGGPELARFTAEGVGTAVAGLEGDYTTWRLPEGATARVGKGAMSEGDRAVALSAEGRYLAVASAIGIWLYEAATSRPAALLSTETGVHSVAFSLDGTLAAGLNNGRVDLWEVETGERIGTLSHGASRSWVMSVAFSRDGATLATGSSEQIIKLWDVETRQHVGTWEVPREEPVHAPTSVAFSPDGSRLVSGFLDGTVRLWDVASRAEVAVLPGHADGIRSVSFSPDGATLASGSWDATVRLWDVGSRSEVAVLRGHTGEVESVSFSPDGASLASGSRDRTVRLWDVATRSEMATLEEHWGPVQSVTYSRDGATLVSGAADGRVLLRDLETGSAAGLSGHASLSSMALSPEGAILASGYRDGTVRLWDVASQLEVATLRGHTGEVQSVSFSSDGSQLASGSWDDPTVKLWEVRTRKLVGTLVHPDGVISVALSPDGATLASVQVWTPTIRLWDTATQTDRAHLRHPGNVLSVVFSPDGTLLAAAGLGKTVTLWDVGARNLIGTLSTLRWDQINAVAFGPEGTILASGDQSGTVQLWDVVTRARLAGFNFQGRSGIGTVSSVTFSPDGTMLVVSGFDPVWLWDVETKERTAILEGHTDWVHSVGFSRDGTILASGSADGSMLLWDVQRLQARPHALTKVSGLAQEVPAGGVAKPFVVEVRDQHGAPLAGATVTFAVTAGTGTLSAATAATDADGRAATTLTLSSEPGTNTVRVTVDGLEPVNFTASGVAIAQTLAKLTGDEQQGPAGAALAEPFVVEVRDQNGQALAGVRVAFAVTAGGGTLSVSRASTDAEGRAATTLTLGSTPGTNVVTATVADLEPMTFRATAKASPDFDGDGVTDFSDFFLFAEAFGGSDPRFDLDASGVVDLADFFLFAQSFGGPARAKLLALARERIGLPDGPQLRQNAPNPFNSATVISWFRLQPGLARLEVFALTGQRVAVLHQGPRKAGLHRLRWDGRDDRGRLLASGVYVYRLVTSEAVQTRKLTVLR